MKTICLYVISYLLSAEIVENVENLWVLSLGLKLLHNSLQSDSNCCMQELYAPDFIQCLVSTASKGTGFSQQWLLKDLEVSPVTVVFKSYMPLISYMYKERTL